MEGSRYRSYGAVILTALLLLPLPGLSGQALGAGGLLYRYQNAEGRTEIADAVPPDRVGAGYQVIDPATGRVLDTVAPQLTPAELIEKEARDRKLAACREDLARIRALYGSVVDIDAAAAQAAEAIETRVGHLRTNRELEQRRLEGLQAEAAQRERIGQPVTPTMQEEMERSSERIAAVNEEIDQRQAEQRMQRARFAAERALYLADTCTPEADAR